ncbi:MAG: TIGR01210 family radical SAM protein [Promethearchaeota archaeon]|nr:MAG: TIGR01210 family radical SAM protein [Candidatus Lokiarchaeota archaeon]
MSEKIALMIKKQTRMLRDRAKERINKHTNWNLQKPVTSWIAEDRLHDEMGYEFTIIFRTCACSWARSDDAGCTMCGYFNDKGPDSILQSQILDQLQYAISKHLKKLDEIQKEGKKTTIKFFSSGSFLDNEEFRPETRIEIIKQVVNLPSIHNILAETRPEFVKEDSLKSLMAVCNEKPLELGIGMESSNDYVREILINKGFSSQNLKDSIKIAHKCGVLVKTYLLLKPPFLNEKTAIRDAVQSIKDAVTWGADSISLNPVNIQAFTLAELLFNHQKYRSPWIYSVISVFQKALTQEILDRVLILCSPSAAGKERGVHNCHDKACNSTWLKIMNEFISTQNMDIIDPKNLPYEECSCWGEYNLFLERSPI